MTHFIVYFCFPMHAVARIGFIETEYTATEGFGSQVGFVIGVIDGNIADSVTIDFATADGSAIGELLTFCIDAL